MPIRTPLCDLLSIDHPIMLAGMGGVSYAEVTAAVSNAGGSPCASGSTPLITTLAARIPMSDSSVKVRPNSRKAEG